MPADSEPIPRVATAAPVRWAFLALGCLSVTSGVIGHFVPIWPSTVFYLSALWCFKRSSPRLEAAMLEHRIVGPLLRDWQTHHGFRPRTRRMAIAGLWAGLTVSALLLRRAEVYAILTTVGIGVTWFLLTRPLLPDEASAESASPPV